MSRRKEIDAGISALLQKRMDEKGHVPADWRETRKQVVALSRERLIGEGRIELGRRALYGATWSREFDSPSDNKHNISPSEEEDPRDKASRLAGRVSDGATVEEALAAYDVSRGLRSNAKKQAAILAIAESITARADAADASLNDFAANPGPSAGNPPRPTDIQ